MKHKLKWLAIGLVCLAGAFLLHPLERQWSVRCILTWGLGIMSCVAFVALFMEFFGKDKFVKGEMRIEEVIPLKKHGCKVVGRLDGRLIIHEPIVIRDRNGNTLRAKVDGIEVVQTRRSAAVDAPVTLLLKSVSPDAVHPNDVISNENT